MRNESKKLTQQAPDELEQKFDLQLKLEQVFAPHREESQPTGRALLLADILYTPPTALFLRHVIHSLDVTINDELPVSTCKRTCCGGVPR